MTCYSVFFAGCLFYDLCEKLLASGQLSEVIFFISYLVTGACNGVLSIMHSDFFQLHLDLYLCLSAGYVFVHF